MTLYDRIGTGYRVNRRPDPRWAALIDDALGDARTVLNVGAGAGSYEPAHRAVVALEPSRAMLAQRPPDAAPAVRGVAGALPFADRSFDAAMAVLTVHHWPDAAAGIAEMWRVAPRQVVVTWEPEVAAGFWLVREYLPEIAAREEHHATAPVITALLAGTAPVEAVTLPVYHDCTDGVLGAYWRRPEAYLDPAVRASISGLALLDQDVVERAMGRLKAGLSSGEWRRAHPELLDAESVDLGYRMLIAGARPAEAPR